MKILLTALGTCLRILGLSKAYSQDKPMVNIEKVEIEIEGKNVPARKLTVYSEIPISLNKAWQNVQTPALLQFIAKGMIVFRPIADSLPDRWEKGKTYGFRMRIFGWIPFGGIHNLTVSELDPETYTISTKEWNKRTKVWHHHIVMKAVDEESIYYEDSILIYGGTLTAFITLFAKRFYKHRQKRWQIVARERLDFYEDS